MDAPARTAEPASPWRTATLIAIAIAGVELVLLVVAGMMLLGRSLAPRAGAATPAHAAHASPTPTRSKSKPGPKATAARRPQATAAHALPRTRTHVVVWNGNGIQGAAAQAAALVRSRGYRVDAVANAPRSGYAAWRVMYRPGFAAEAQRFGKDMGLGGLQVGPLDGLRPSKLHGAELVLILGRQR